MPKLTRGDSEILDIPQSTKETENIPINSIHVQMFSLADPTKYLNEKN